MCGECWTTARSADGNPVIVLAPTLEEMFAGVQMLDERRSGSRAA
jgi:hypothetical protein